MSELSDPPNVQEHSAQTEAPESPLHTTSTPHGSTKEQVTAPPKPRSWSKWPGDPPIEVWEKKLWGKRLIPEDATGDDTTFKESDLSKPYVIHPGAMDCSFQRNRLNVWLNKENIVECVSYN